MILIGWSGAGDPRQEQGGEGWRARLWDVVNGLLFHEVHLLIKFDGSTAVKAVITDANTVTGHQIIRRAITITTHDQQTGLSCTGVGGRTDR